MTSLHIPALAITNGAADPEWAQVPLSRWRFQRSPSQRLPLDPRTAKSVRRYTRLAPWSLLTTLVAVAAWSALAFADLSSSGRTAAIAVAWSAILWSLLEQRGLPRHLPYRTRSGDLRIPQVPVEVADRWVAHNPGVIATDEPAPPAHSRRFYAIWAAGLLTASAGLAVVMATNGRVDSVLLWMLMPVLLFTGISMALKAQPPAKGGNPRTWPPGIA